MISHFLSAGEGLVPEPADEAQAPEAGGGVSGGAAEEEGQPARQPLEGRHAAAGGRRRGRDQRRLERTHTHTHAHSNTVTHSHTHVSTLTISVSASFELMPTFSFTLLPTNHRTLDGHESAKTKQSEKPGTCISGGQ